MDNTERVVFELVTRLEQQGYAQVPGYNRFGYVRQTGSYVVVSREKGKDTKIPLKKIAAAVDAVRKDSSVYTGGPSRLRRHGLTHITSPLWAILHLLTVEELRK